MERDFILSEVRRTAAANGGSALGRVRLETETGIKDYHWSRFWSRYSDLVREAGHEPNKYNEAIAEVELCAAIAGLAREIGRFPTQRDLHVKRTHDKTFPSPGVFDRLGNKTALVVKVAAYAMRTKGNEDVAAMCEAVTPKKEREAPTKSSTAHDGHVYLMKSGKFYKIGFSVHAGSRERQVAIQLPEAVTTVHVIVTDDPPGIEAYWHRRFAEKRKNGEWFDLTREDVAAFRRRKFM